MTSLVQLQQLTKRYGAIEAVAPTDLDIAAGEFLAILGPSGCGKTSLLRMIGGFVQPSDGRILLEGRDVTHIGPERRPTNMVFQGYGLFPHMTVAQNVAYGLRLAGVAQSERDKRVREALALVQLEDFETRRIDQMSGGQKQRVALARALIMRPKVLLLDEPLAALDLKLRRAMQEEFRRIHQAIGGTFIFVTHDQEEAMSLASRICVMDKGRILQDGSPEDIYRRPLNRFVSRFIGEANIFPGRRSGGVVTLANGIVFDCDGPDGDVDVVVRPEDMTLAGDAGSEALQVRATVTDEVYLGPQRQIRATDTAGVDLMIMAPPSAPAAVPGETVTLSWPRSKHRVVTE